MQVKSLIERFNDLNYVFLVKSWKKKKFKPKIDDVEA